MKASHTACHANILKVSVETNCPQGGDSGHGGRTVIEFEDEAGTDMSVKAFGPFGRHIVLTFGGDAECLTAIECLRWAADELERQWKANSGR